MKNLFLSRINRADRLYRAVTNLPHAVRRGLAGRYTDFMTRRIIKRGFPDRVTIFLTNQCNMRCLHCFIVKEGREKDWQMGPEEYSRFFSSASRRLSHVLFTGGEPTLRKDFSDILMLAAIIGKCPSASIFTNGFLQDRLVEALLRALKQTRLTLSLQFSIDGLEQFHDGNRRMKGSLKNALSSIDAVLDIKKRFPKRFGRIAAATIISKSNMDALADIIRLVARTGVLHAFDFVRGSRVSVFNLKDRQELSDNQPSAFSDYPTGEDMEKALEVINSELWSKRPPNLFYATNRVILRTIKETVKSGRPVTRCMAGLADVILMPNGDVARCEMLKPCANLKYFNWDLSALVASQRFRDNYQKTCGCYCAHGCAIGTAIMYDKDLLNELMRTQ